MKKEEQSKAQSQLSPEELELLTNARDRKAKQEAVEQEIIDVLKKHNAALQVNPDSPIRQLMIQVVLL